MQTFVFEIFFVIMSRISIVIIGFRTGVQKLHKISNRKELPTDK